MFESGLRTKTQLNPSFVRIFFVSRPQYRVALLQKGIRGDVSSI